MAEIVASGVLPFRPAQRPESITRLATSFALSGPAAARSTSIATCFADSPITFCFAIVDGLLLLVVAFGVRRRGDEGAALRRSSDTGLGSSRPGRAHRWPSV